MVICTANQKGGPGKTCSAINVAALLARGGQQRVLAVDADQQATLNRQLGIDTRLLLLTLADVLSGRAGADEATVRDVHGIDVIPGARELASVEMSLVGELGRERFLHDALQPVIARYDAIVIDTAPNLGLITVNGLWCADTVLVPVAADDPASVQGVLELRATLSRLEQLRGSGPRLVTILTRWQPGRIVGELVDQALADDGLAPVAKIPARALVAQAAAAQQPLAAIAPDSAVAIAYQRTVDQLLGAEQESVR
jgi:chromosome partitioning protein